MKATRACCAVVAIAAVACGGSGGASGTGGGSAGAAAGAAGAPRAGAAGGSAGSAATGGSAGTAALGGGAGSAPVGGDAGSTSLAGAAGSASLGGGTGTAATGHEILLAQPPGAGPAVITDHLEAGDRTKDVEGDEIDLDGRYGKVAFWPWLPGGIKRLRGVIINAGLDVHYQELARLTNFALLGAADWNNAGERTEWIALVDEALKRFGAKTGHPELAKAPFIGTGHSAGTGPIAFLNDETPARVVAGAPGGLEYTPANDAARRNPFLIWYGSADATQSIKHVANLEAMRAEHALYGIAPQWGNGHSWSLGTNLSHPMFWQTIARRLFDSSSADGAVALQPIDEADGWLGDRNGWIQTSDGRWRDVTKGALPTIAPFRSFTGDKTKAIWLVDSYVAAVWRAFLSSDEVVTLVRPVPQNSDDKSSVTLLEPGAKLAASAKLADGAMVTKVDLMDGDRVLATKTAAPFDFPPQALAPGVHAIAAIATTSDGAVHTSYPSTIYAMRVPCPPAPFGNIPFVCVKTGASGP